MTDLMYKSCELVGGILCHRQEIEKKLINKDILMQINQIVTSVIIQYLKQFKSWE